VAAFRARVVATLHTWLPVAPPRPLLIVHKGIIASIVTELLHLSLAERAAFPIDLASIHVLVTNGRDWHAERVNDTAHLDGLS
jgi:broad specificity phosphatase PhoE